MPRNQQQQQKQQNNNSSPTTSHDEEAENYYDESDVASDDEESQQHLHRVSRDMRAGGRVVRTRGQNKKRSNIKKNNNSELKSALANRCYHLPGNRTWCQDWRQYFCNNHPILGICFHHKLHPVGAKIRWIALVGSLLFGVTISNIFFFWSLQHESYNDPLFTVSFASSSAEDADANVRQWEVTPGMLLLWSVGSATHALYDNVIWYVASCACCCVCQKAWRGFGFYILTFLLVVMSAFASLAILLRASADEEETNVDYFSTDQDLQNLFSIDGDHNMTIVNTTTPTIEVRELRPTSFDFLVAYLTEVSLALVVYYPLVGTILFSGILGCGILPILGGRPREIYLEEYKLNDPKTMNRGR